MTTLETASNPMDAEEAALRTQWNELLAKYPNEYIALHHGQVAAHGPNDEELAAEMFARFGDAPFYIAFLSAETRIYEIPSPEIV